MADDPAPEPNPAPEPDPNPVPPAADARPEWLPENLWDAEAGKPVDFSTLRQPAADLPASADAYALPKDGDKDLPESIASSPFLTTLRNAAFANGVGQEGFNGLVSEWLQADTAAADAYYSEQEKLIGQNKDARASAISTWLDGSLPAEEAAALRDLATDAKVFHALEKLMNKGAAPAAPRNDVPNPTPGDTVDTIKALMATPAYSGKANQRDPSVIARVDKFWEDEAKREAAKK